MGKTGHMIQPRFARFKGFPLTFFLLQSPTLARGRFLMKGVVFTEFIEMVEQEAGFEMVDAILQAAHPASGGAYTGVGLYDDAELFALVAALSEKSGTPVPALLKHFGEHLFSRFVCMFPHFVDPAPDVFALLQSVDGFIHVEVHKLYPDALLPAVACELIGKHSLKVRYQSHRPLGDFAEGLLRGAMKHYNEHMDVQRTDLDPQKRKVEFVLTRIP
jgi:hypothetical protein